MAVPSPGAQHHPPAGVYGRAGGRKPSFGSAAHPTGSSGLSTATVNTGTGNDHVMRASLPPHSTCPHPRRPAGGGGVHLAGGTSTVSARGRQIGSVPALAGMECGGQVPVPG